MSYLLIEYADEYIPQLFDEMALYEPDDEDYNTSYSYSATESSTPSYINYSPIDYSYSMPQGIPTYEDIQRLRAEQIRNNDSLDLYG